MPSQRKQKEHRTDPQLSIEEKLARKLFRKYKVTDNPRAQELFDLIYSRLESWGFEGDHQLVQDEFAAFVTFIINPATN